MDGNDVDELKTMLKDLIGDEIDIDYLITSTHNYVTDELENKSTSDLFLGDFLTECVERISAKVESDIDLRNECLVSPNLLQNGGVSSAPPLEHMRSIINLKEYFNN